MTDLLAFCPYYFDACVKATFERAILEHNGLSPLLIFRPIIA